MEKDQNHRDEFQNDRYGYVTLKDSDTVGRVCVPEDARGIADAGFLWCEQVTEVFLSDSVTCISESGFFRCPTLTEITVPDGVICIGDSAFEDCADLADVTLPVGIQYIGGCAFAECPRLTSIRYGGTTAQWARVTKDRQWDAYSVLGVIHCADGDIPL